MKNLNSLRRNEEERKSQLEIEALRTLGKKSERNKRVFEETQENASKRLTNMLQNGKIQSNENFEVSIYVGKPEEYSLDNQRIIRGVIEDIQYSEKEGAIVLKKGRIFPKRHKIPFSQLVILNINLRKEMKNKNNTDKK